MVVLSIKVKLFPTHSSMTYYFIWYARLSTNTSLAYFTSACLPKNTNGTSSTKIQLSARLRLPTDRPLDDHDKIETRDDVSQHFYYLIIYAPLLHWNSFGDIFLATAPAVLSISSCYLIPQLPIIIIIMIIKVCLICRASSSSASSLINDIDDKPTDRGPACLPVHPIMGNNNFKIQKFEYFLV